MTVPTSTKAAAAAATGSPGARQDWVTPALVRMNGTEAENTANPGGTDGIFSSGS